MKLYIKQKVFSWTDRFTIKDSEETDRYLVEGEFLSFGRKLHVYDANQREVAFLKQKLMSFYPRFEVYLDGHLTVEVVKEMTLLKPHYTLTGTDWQLDGDFWERSYTITSHGKIIATIAKVWCSWGDSYEIDILDDANEVLVLACVLAIDCALAK